MLSQEKEVLFIGSIEEVKNNFPSELLDLPNWVVSEVIFNEKKSATLGYAKFDKFPKALDGIHGAKSNDSSTWHSFDEVAAACQSLNVKNRRRDVIPFLYRFKHYLFKQPGVLSLKQKE